MKGHFPFRSQHADDGDDASVSNKTSEAYFAAYKKLKAESTLH